MKRHNLDIAPVISKKPVRHNALRKTFTYENNTGTPVYVTDSTGSYIIIEPKRNVISPNAIVVYVTYSIPAGMANLIGIADTLPAAVYQNLCRELDRFGESTLMYIVEDPVPILRGEAIVLENLGLSFSVRPLELDKTPVHRNGQATELTLGIVVVQRHDDTRVIKWVRYYNTMVQVVPIKAKFYEPGMYLVMMSGDIVEGSRLLHFDFDDPMSPMRGFETEEAARQFRWVTDAVPALSDLRNKLEAQIAANDLSYAQHKQQLDVEHRRKLNDMTIEREQQAALFRELEMKVKQRAEERKDSFDERSTLRKDHYDERSTVRKDQSDERKEHYENRSQTRKDASETLKAIPAILAAGVAIVAMLM
ncbi:hypothetical protein pSALSNUABM04_081 [Salmonella phage pSal-SNUABM-04]|nr:hypothetical protein pSALSNUABM04_081 [Salmonella phage pSal-SNUABM-04]